MSEHDCGGDCVPVDLARDEIDAVCNTACGWAFDCGMREAERDDARAAIEDLKEFAEVLGDAVETLEQEHAAALPAAVAAERERCAAEYESLFRDALTLANFGCFSDPYGIDAKWLAEKQEAQYEEAAERVFKAAPMVLGSGAPAPREG